MLWVKALHIVFVVTWFAGLFYLPRLYVYHALAEDAVSRERFKVMERKLFWGIMTPSGALTLYSARGCGSAGDSPAPGCRRNSRSSPRSSFITCGARS